jgi:hypothetical protein
VEDNPNSKGIAVITESITKEIYDLPEHQQLREDVRNFIVKQEILQTIQNCPMCAQHREAKNLWRKVALDLFTRQK